MNKKKYLEMNYEELYQYFISDIMSDSNKGKLLINELSESWRYQNDDRFQTFVDTGKAVLFALKGENTQVIPLCTNLIDRSATLELWQLLATNWNLLGSSYYLVGLSERALECYHNVIKTESTHGLLTMTSAAYNNIALLYLNLQAYEKTYEYFQKAIAALEQANRNQPRYTTKLVSYLSALIQALCMMQRLDEIPPIRARIEQIDKSELHPNSLFIYHSGEMYYAFYTGAYEQGKAAFHRAKYFIAQDDILRKTSLSNAYITLCEHFHLSYSFYLDELLAVESLEDSANTSMNVEMYMALRNYYQQIGDWDCFAKTNIKYINLLEKNARSIRSQKLESLQITEALIRDNSYLADIRSKNTELQHIAEEALHHKNALQNAYQRIELIHQLGRKLTSSIHLTEVMDLIHQNLQENIPIKNFTLMAVEPEKNQLRSVAYYENNKLQSGFCIRLDNPDSVFAECYRRNQIICSDDLEQDPYFHGRPALFVGESSDTQSVIFMPLNVGEHLIGVCSIQGEGSHIYTDKHIAFLQDLLPYLSIALNNALRSQALKKEIQSHLQTQKELKKANERLNRLSFLDGLTQISNRRDFEKRMLGLLQKAQEEEEAVSLFMFDIDYFKVYNDTYGHLAGDEALRKVAQVIQKNMMPVNGLSARFGGEEFIAACIGLNSEKSKQLAEQIRQEVYKLNLENRNTPLRRLSLSIGVAVTEQAKKSKKSALMRWSDLSLYRAKNSGKNKVILKEVCAKEKLPASFCPSQYFDHEHLAI